MVELCVDWLSALCISDFFPSPSVTLVLSVVPVGVWWSWGTSAFNWVKSSSSSSWSLLLVVLESVGAERHWYIWNTEGLIKTLEKKVPIFRFCQKLKKPDGWQNLTSTDHQLSSASSESQEWNLFQSKLFYPQKKKQFQGFQSLITWRRRLCVSSRSHLDHMFVQFAAI